MKVLLLVIFTLLCCKVSMAQFSFCTIAIKADSVKFLKKSVFLNRSAKKKLDALATILNKEVSCRIAVTGYGNNCMTCQQISWDRVYSVIKYLRQAGVDSTRFIFSAAQDGNNPLVVTIRSLQPGEDGPALVPPYIPCYSYHRLTKKRCKGSN